MDGVEDVKAFGRPAPLAFVLVTLPVVGEKVLVGMGEPFVEMIT